MKKITKTPNKPIEKFKCEYCGCEIETDEYITHDVSSEYMIIEIICPIDWCGNRINKRLNSDT